MIIYMYMIRYLYIYNIESKEISSPSPMLPAAPPSAVGGNS